MQATSATTDVPESTREATTLDRIHAGMLLQASGRTEALRSLIRTEQDRGPDFLRLSNALSALYPRGSEEKRTARRDALGSAEMNKAISRLR